MAKYLFGYDLGSSSVKASLIEIATGKTMASAQSPSEEMPMKAVMPGWAEQDPDMWWEHLVASTHACLKKSGAKGDEVAGIGISYQMHGLVCVDADDIAVIKSMYGEHANHEPALYLMHTGRTITSRPAIGAWVDTFSLPRR